MGLTLVLTPYILYKLGIQLFAIWSLIFVVTTYLGFLDFGISSSFAKYIAEYNAKKDFTSLNSVITCGLLFFAGYSIILVLVAYLIKDFLIVLLKIPPQLHYEFIFTMMGMIIVVAVFNIFVIFREVLIGLQRMDLSNKIIIFSSFFYIFGTIFFLEKGQGIKGLVYSSALRALVMILGSIFFSFRLLPRIKIGLKYAEKIIFKKLFNYGIKMQLSTVAGIVHFQTDKIIISYFLGLNFVTFYDLGQKIATGVREFPIMILSALVPAISEMDAVKDHSKLKDLYYRGSKYLALTVFPLIFLTVILAKDIINLWIGKGYGLAILTLQVIILEYGLNVLTGMGTCTVRGIGKPEYETRYAVLVAVLQLILGITLIQLIGFPGILVSLVISGFCGNLYFLIIFHRMFKESFKELAKKVYPKPFLGSLIAAALIFFIGEFLRNLISFSSRWGNLFWLVLNLTIFLVVYLFLIIKMNYLKETEVRPLMVYFRPKLADKICSMFSR